MPVDEQLIGPEEYLQIRKRLVFYFRQRGAVDPEELADETLFRLVNRLKAGVEITTSLGAFSYGIAANVLSEWRKQPVPEDLPPPELTPETNNGLGAEKRVYLRQALNLLPIEEARLLARYYLEDPEEVARDLGIEVSALRVRISRIRSRLRAELGRNSGRNGAAS